MSGSFGELELIVDSAVNVDFETLVQRQSNRENRIAGLDLTGFTIDKLNQGGYNIQDTILLFL